MSIQSDKRTKFCKLVLWEIIVLLMMLMAFIIWTLTNEKLLLNGDIHQQCTTLQSSSAFGSNNGSGNGSNNNNNMSIMDILQQEGVIRLARHLVDVTRRVITRYTVISNSCLFKLFIGVWNATFMRSTGWLFIVQGMLYRMLPWDLIPDTLYKFGQIDDFIAGFAVGVGTMFLLVGHVLF